MLGTIFGAILISSKATPDSMKPFCMSTTISAVPAGSISSNTCSLPRSATTRSMTLWGMASLCIARLEHQPDRAMYPKVGLEDLPNLTQVQEVTQPTPCLMTVTPLPPEDYNRRPGLGVAGQKCGMVRGLQGALLSISFISFRCA